MGGRRLDGWPLNLALTYLVSSRGHHVIRRYGHLQPGVQMSATLVSMENLISRKIGDHDGSSKKYFVICIDLRSILYSSSAHCDQQHANRSFRNRQFAHVHYGYTKGAASECLASICCFISIERSTCTTCSYTVNDMAPDTYRKQLTMWKKELRYRKSALTLSRTNLGVVPFQRMRTPPR